MSRVVILQDYVPDYRVPFFRELSRMCRREGIELSIAAGAPTGHQAQRGDAAELDLDVTRLQQRELSIAGRRVTARSIRRAVQGADLLIIEQARRNLDAYRLLLPRRMWPAPLMAMWGHGTDFVTHKSRVETEVSRLLTRRVDHFFAYTDEGAQYVESAGLSPSQITTVRNAIDTREFESALRSITDQEVEAFRQEHRLTGLVLLYIGGLDESKRIRFLLDAAQRLAQSESEFRLLVVGDGVMRPTVERVAGSSPNVVYLGRLTGRAKATAFRAANALVIPGRVGLVAVESIAARTPILTTDWPYHAPEFGYLTRGSSIFVSDNSVPAFATLMGDVLSSPESIDRARKELDAMAPQFGVLQMADNFRRGIEATLAARHRVIDSTVTTVTHVLGELRPSGAEMMILDAVSWFAEHGIRTRVLATGAAVGPMAAEFAAKGVDVVHVPFDGKPSFLLRLCREVPSESVAHVHTERASFWVCMALKLRRAHVTRSIHSVFGFSGCLRARRLIQRRLLKLAGVEFVSIHDQVRENERERFWLSTRVIRNFSGEKFTRQQHTLAGQQPSRLVSVGNCGAPKNHEVILEALALLRSRGQAWHYEHVGAEDQSVVDERDLANRLGLASSVDFRGQADPVEALLRADVFVMPSHYEGLGIAALEAITLGIPVLLADSPGLRAFKEAPGLWWCPPEPMSIAEQLSSIRATSADELAMRASAARAWALEEFSRDRSLQAWLDVYLPSNGGRG